MRQSRIVARKRQNVLMEAVEKRLCMDATYHNLAGGAFSQNWTNTGLITADDIWSGVPSIIGNRGDNLTADTNGADPQLILNYGTGPDDVNANKPDPTAFFTGGVTEFELTDPVVALTGSGTADAPFLLIHLNASGRQNIQVSYNLRDIENSADPGVQKVALQYRSGTSGNFTNVPAAYVSNATDGSTGTATTAVSNIVLPAGAENAGQLQLRIITTNASGNDQWVGVDDIVVTSDPIVTPTVGFEFASYSVTEDGLMANINVNRAGNSGVAFDVFYTTTDGAAANAKENAVAPGDYTAASNQIIQFASGDITKQIQIPISNDSISEAAESFTIALSGATNGVAYGTQNATVTIAKSDFTQPTGVVLNEIETNPVTGQTFANGDKYCYVELYGADPNTSLVNLYFIVVEGDGAGAGAIDGIIDLSTATIGSNNLLVLHSPTGGHTISAPTGSFTSTIFDALNGDGFEIGGNSFFLVYSTDTLTPGSDIDTNNDGTIDNLPAGATIIDGVGYKDTVDDLAYGAILPSLPNGTSPDGLTRELGNYNPLTANDWYYGELIDGSADAVLYDSLKVSGNTPTGAYLTPGAANYAGSVSAGQLEFQVANIDVNESVGTATVTVVRNGGGAGAVGVNFATVGGGSASAGSDYTSTSGTLTFVDGDLSETFTVSITGDGVQESSETINLQLTLATGGASLGSQTTSTITILDDDAPAPTGILMNEVKVDTPSVDEPYEYIEIKGTPNMALTNVFVLSVEGDGAGAGAVDRVFDLTGLTIGDNGLLVIKAPGAGHTITNPNLPGGPTVVENSVFASSGGALENDANSFMVVYRAVGGITTANDIDSNNDGTPDLAGLVILDSVGWKQNGTNGTVYGAVLYTPANHPGAATRFPGTSTPNAAGEWYAGDVATDNTSVAYDTNVSANFPVGGVLTPGAVNVGTYVADTTPPTVASAVLNTTSANTVPYITVTFSEGVQTPLASDFTLIDRNTLAAIPFGLSVINSTTARLTFAGGPPDAHMRLTVGTTIKDVAGNNMAVASVHDISFLLGDLTNANTTKDNKVTTLDFNVFAGNFGTGTSADVGNLNYTGGIDSLDFVIFAAQYGKSLPTPPPAPVLFGSALGGESLFGDTDLSDDILA